MERKRMNIQLKCINTARSDNNYGVVKGKVYKIAKSGCCVPPFVVAVNIF